jgi:hypothetical protein
MKILIFFFLFPSVLFRFPVINTDGEKIDSQMIIGMDHDPEYYGKPEFFCVNYNGDENFPFCYDSHNGTDFMLTGGFEMMDSIDTYVVAAADGQIADTDDGNYDHCHLDFNIQDVSCDGYDMAPNYVEIEHDDGTVSIYYHLKKNSVIVSIGDYVKCGDLIGIIGSSGYSTAPHLHFEVKDKEGSVIDPYAGKKSQPKSMWVKQKGNYGLPGEFCENELKVDTDKDSVPDILDNCPFTYNPDQKDSDVNGIGDACDTKPETVEIPDKADEIIAEKDTEPSIEVTDASADTSEDIVIAEKNDIPAVEEQIEFEKDVNSTEDIFIPSDEGISIPDETAVINDEGKISEEIADVSEQNDYLSGNEDVETYVPYENICCKTPAGCFITGNTDNQVIIYPALIFCLLIICMRTRNSRQGRNTDAAS